MNKKIILEIKELRAEIEGKEILKGVNLTINEGETIAIMGPNGSGKSTLANTLMGHPGYKITKGTIIYKGENITTMTPDERARKGIFLSFQYPQEITGVSMTNFLRQALKSKGDTRTLTQYKKYIKEQATLLKLDQKFFERNVNEGFSGGEKKKAEIFQLAVLNPEISILDETDSGLDIDALKTVANGVNTIKQKKPTKTFIIITHYQRLLDHIKPDKVYILENGAITRSGGAEIAQHLEKHGYEIKDSGFETRDKGYEIRDTGLGM